MNVRKSADYDVNESWTDELETPKADLWILASPEKCIPPAPKQ
jgi:hypothetical protein